MLSRHRSREIALQVLFQREFHVQNVPPVQLVLQELYHKDQENLAYSLLLIEGTKKHEEEIDILLKQHSLHWKVERMPIVDRNILRMSVFEMLFAIEKIDPASIINEAIELAKKFGQTESPSFVNGLLDQIAKKELRIT